MGQNQSGQNFGQGGPPGGTGGDKKDQVSMSGRIVPQSVFISHLLFEPIVEAIELTTWLQFKLLLWLYTVTLAVLQAEEKKKKWEPPVPPPRVGKKQKKRGAAAGLGTKLPNVTPNAKCKLRLLKLERIKDWLLMEEEFVANQERLKPQEERNEEDRSKVPSC